MKTLAIDYGEKRIGLAISDELGIASAPLPILNVRSDKESLKAIARAYEGNNAERIVMGIPLKPDGSHGKEAQTIKDFAGKLKEKLNTEIIFWDEYLSSKGAEINKRSNKGIDSEAARLILQEFLNSNGQ